MTAGLRSHASTLSKLHFISRRPTELVYRAAASSWVSPASTRPSNLSRVSFSAATHSGCSARMTAPFDSASAAQSHAWSSSSATAGGPAPGRLPFAAAYAEARRRISRTV
eukprot:gene22596-biopygen22926